METVAEIANDAGHAALADKTENFDIGFLPKSLTGEAPSVCADSICLAADMGSITITFIFLGRQNDIDFLCRYGECSCGR